MAVWVDVCYVAPGRQKPEAYLGDIGLLGCLRPIQEQEKQHRVGTAGLESKRVEKVQPTGNQLWSEVGGR